LFEAIDQGGFTVSALVYLTDGDGTYPDYLPAYPVIWVLNKKHSVPWGQKIDLEVA